jgi:hypothetical protein
MMYYSLGMLGNRWYNPIMDKELKSHKITVDIPQDVWEAMRALASEHQRSFVKELVWALQDYVRRERRKGALRDG